MKNIKRELISNDFRYSWQHDLYNEPIDSNGVQTSKRNLIKKTFSLLIWPNKNLKSRMLFLVVFI